MPDLPCDRDGGTPPMHLSRARHRGRHRPRPGPAVPVPGLRHTAGTRRETAKAASTAARRVGP
ncbi:hypothetical protein GCM10023329_45620 [Streptomyces sanyensis]|uniref:Uncharacterized protein n=1 Tax=Streptomyces sanyensis TaxID=568869 RepID=A0ABP9B191_9ACTN